MIYDLKEFKKLIKSKRLKFLFLFFFQQMADSTAQPSLPARTEPTLRPPLTLRGREIPLENDFQIPAAEQARIDRIRAAIADGSFAETYGSSLKQT